MKNLIGELERIRVRVTQIYMKLGNPKDCRGDMVLRDDIDRLKRRGTKRLTIVDKLKEKAELP